MISVIVPVYKVEGLIDRCVSSILAQSYRDFELILVDDGSPDASGSICDEWAKRDARVQVFHKPNGGAADARNFALDRMRGEYVTFADSDDYVDRDYLSDLMGLIEKHPNCTMAVAGLVCVRNGHEYRIFPNREGEVSGRDVLEDILYEAGVLPSLCAKLYHRSIFDGLRFRCGMMFEDEDVFGEIMSRAASVAVGKGTHYYYVQNPESVSYRAFSPRKYENQMTADEHLCRSALALDPSLVAAVSRRHVRNYMSLLRLMGGCRKEFKQYVTQLRKMTLRLGLCVLLDRKASWRDKFGILALVPGGWSFFLAWMMYDFVRNHRGGGA